MFELRTITLLICATTVLTSTIDPTVNDGSSKETRADADERSNDQAGLQSTSKPIIASIKNISNNNTRPPVKVGTNGTFHQVEPTDASTVVSNVGLKSTVVAEGIKLTSDGVILPDSDRKIAKTRKASVVARKGAIPTSKISPRKGVELESSTPTTSSSSENTDDVRSSIDAIATTPRTKVPSSISKTDETNNSKKSASETKSTSMRIDMTVPTNNTNSTMKNHFTTPTTLINVTAKIDAKINVGSSSTSLSPANKKPFKPKPTVTIGEMDVDKPIPASPTKTPPLGMPRKIDYIVPVIITIMALPLLGGAAFILWRRGRDCWDKRHYRRMDFLIDGMYNDHSWK